MYGAPMDPDRNTEPQGLEGKYKRADLVWLVKTDLRHKKKKAPKSAHSAMKPLHVQTEVAVYTAYRLHGCLSIMTCGVADAVNLRHRHRLRPRISGEFLNRRPPPPLPPARAISSKQYPTSKE